MTIIEKIKLVDTFPKIFYIKIGRNIKKGDSYYCVPNYISIIFKFYYLAPAYTFMFFLFLLMPHFFESLYLQFLETSIMYIFIEYLLIGVIPINKAKKLHESSDKNV